MDARHIDPHHDRDHERTNGVDVRDIIRVAFVAIVAAAVWFHMWEPWPRVSVLGLIGTIVGGWPIFHEA